VSGYRVTREFPYSQEQVWRTLTDPELIPLWTTAGRGGRPEGFIPEAGTHFRYIATPIPPFWNGIVECDVLEIDPPRLLRYTWVGDEGARPSIVTCAVEPAGNGTRLTWEHTDFAGIDGYMMSKLLGRVRRKMLDDPVNGFPAALEHLEDSP
jgi:uncharacterized protein YndB with AHSA1/START domain